MPSQQGLTRVAHTYGSVDLVLLAGEDVDTCDPLLGRVTHPASLIFQWDGQAWQQIQRKNLGQRGGREAA